jgi:hypothetical protein
MWHYFEELAKSSLIRHQHSLIAALDDNTLANL